METEELETRFSEYDSIVSLLRRWQPLDGSARSLQTRSPEIRVFLREVSDRIESGRWRTSGWNIFEVLGCVRREDAHSDALAWLFKPWEAHGLGARFLLDFVRTGTGRVLPNSRVREVETRKTIGTDGEKIDIEVQGDNWVLAVENKIDHYETLGQTEGYAAHYSRLKEKDVAVFGVFLTLQGYQAKAHDSFQPMSYTKLRGILERHRIPDSTDAAQFIRWFAKHIRNDLERRL